MIYIIGHTKPDLDSVVSAYALQKLYHSSDCFGYGNTKAVLADTANFETKTVFDRFDSYLPHLLNSDEVNKQDRFILVDHNESSQRSDHIVNDKIIEIIDHHKAVVEFVKPISMIFRPWGAATTIVYWLMASCQFQPDKTLASLMLGAILSDTVGLQSPTTTQVDRTTAQKLNQVAKIKDLKSFTYDIFKAKSDVSGLSIKQILTKDSKIFEFNGEKVLINQIETVQQDKVISNSAELIAGIIGLKDEMKLNRAYCLVTDILKINSKMLCAPEDEELLTVAFPGAKIVSDGVYDIGALISRKKEVAPAIAKAINKI